LFDYKTGKLKQQAVFDLVADPLERNDIRVDAQDPVHRRLSDGLATMLRDVRHYKLPFPLTVYDVKLGDFLEQQAGAGKTVHKTLTTDQAERLRSLGYMQ